MESGALMYVHTKKRHMLLPTFFTPTIIVVWGSALLVHGDLFTMGSYESNVERLEICAPSHIIRFHSYIDYSYFTQIIASEATFAHPTDTATFI